VGKTRLAQEATQRAAAATVSWGRWGAAAPASGKSATMDIHHWWRFRDGKVCFYRGTEDTAQTQGLLRGD
jgi:ketosteroid isomerase-like protein